MMKSGTLVGVALLVIGVAVPKAQSQRPLFRAATRLVEVSVTVVDKKGNAVTGLEPADFVVLDQGKARPVDVFRFDGGTTTAAVGAAADSLPAGTFTNLPALTDDAPRNVTALVLDNINTTPLQGVTARAQMMRYLRTLAPQTITAVYLMADKLYVLHDFTDDAAALRAKVERAKLAAPTAWEPDDRRSIVEAEMLLAMFIDDPEMYESDEERPRLRSAGGRDSPTPSCGAIGQSGAWHR